MNYHYSRSARVRKQFDREQTARLLRHRRQCPKGPPSFADMTAADFLFETAKELRKAGQDKAPGPDGVHFGDIGVSDLAAISRDLHRVLLDGTWQPSTARLAPIPKPDGTQRVLKIRSVATQIVAGAVHRWLAPYLETIYLPTSFGFRANRGIQDMWLEVERRIVLGNAWCIGQDDVRRAFDNIIIDLVMGDFARHIKDQRLLSLINQLLTGNPREQRQVGIDQGMATSPSALNLHLHHRLDMPLQAVVPSGVLRYADNLVYPATTVHEGQETIRKAQVLLNRVGLVLKGEEAPADLARGETVEILGLRHRAERGRLRHDLGEHAWAGLRETIQNALGTENPARSANDAIQGWVAAYGPAFVDVRRQPLADRTCSEATALGISEVLPDRVSAAMQAAGDRWLARRAEYGLVKAPPEVKGDE